MPEIIEKDIISVDSGIILHCVNCKGKMGAGIAKTIKLKWPIVYQKYVKAYELGLWKLGQIQIIKVSDNLFVGNVAGQYNYGRDKRYVDYDALKICFHKVNIWSIKNNIQVYIPYKIACSNAGGSWDIVYSIICQELHDSIICKISNTPYS